MFNDYTILKYAMEDVALSKGSFPSSFFPQLPLSLLNFSMSNHLIFCSYCLLLEVEISKIIKLIFSSFVLFGSFNGGVAQG
ncbi:MAG: hypothetical protein FWF00_00195 [Endomicrobia bacterium]|nr:hypothetical protein [Endomicrobiia bacterium]MCL2506097.1 hypothetical protein [Endomicrobiia bacterium]